jgi:predicted CXXCH cytochrome family protein
MHVLRPLDVVLAVGVIILMAQAVIAPKDFGTHESGYMYGWYRKSNEAEWKDFMVKYQGRAYCKDCHSEPSQKIQNGFHSSIECENCHGPAFDHPSEPPKLSIDRSRDLCLRCHALLPYPTSKRFEIKGIQPDAHNPGGECSACHEAHKPSKPE